MGERKEQGWALLHTSASEEAHSTAAAGASASAQSVELSGTGAVRSGGAAIQPTLVQVTPPALPPRLALPPLASTLSLRARALFSAAETPGL